MSKSEQSIDNTVKRQLAILREVGNIGLNPAYDDPYDFMFDFFPNFSWNELRRIQEISRLVRHKELEEIAAMWDERAYSMPVIKGADPVGLVDYLNEVLVMWRKDENG